MNTSIGSNHDLAQAGFMTGRSMLAAIDGKELGSQVSLDAKDFRHIATLLIALARSASQCGGEDCFARPVNGVRAWVPVAEHERRLRECADANLEVARLRDALNSIATSANPMSLSLLRRKGASARAIARTALEDRPRARTGAHSGLQDPQ